MDVAVERDVCEPVRWQVTRSWLCGYVKAMETNGAVQADGGGDREQRRCGSRC